MDGHLPFSYWENIGEMLNTMRKEAILTDVVVKCGGQKFQAHRNYLSAASEYFNKRFNNPNKKSSKLTVNFPTVDPKSMEIILEILYTGKLRKVDFTDMKQILRTSNVLQLQDIYSHYLEILISILKKRNFLKVWDIAESLNDQDLLNAIYGKLDEFYSEDDFKTISENRMENLLCFFTVKDVPSHDFLLIVLSLWANQSNGSYSTAFYKFLNYIDPNKLTNNHIKHILHEPKNIPFQKILNLVLALPVTAYQFVFDLQEIRAQNLNPCIVVLGKDDKKDWCLQRCKKGDWDTYLLEDMVAEEAVVALYMSTFCFLTKQRGSNKMEVFLHVLDKDGRQTQGENLGTISDESKLAIAAWKKHMAVFTYDKNEVYYDLYFDKKTIYSYSFNTSRNIIKIEVLIDNNERYEVSQEVKADSTCVLNIWKFSDCVGHWQKIVEFPWDDNKPNWSATFTFPIITIRFFPGKIVYFDVSERTLLISNEKNQLSNIVSAQILGETLWCLTREGHLYVRDTKEKDTKFKAISIPSAPLKVYKQLIVHERNP